MRLADLLSLLPAVRLPMADLSEQIRSLVIDSRAAGPGSLFVCLRGQEKNGHDFVWEAWRRGCRAFVCEYPPKGICEGACVAYVPDTRLALATLSAAFYGYPERRLDLIAITGTKGKTTTAMMICRLLSAAGVPVGYIGSGGARYADIRETTENTTPDALTLRRLFADMCSRGIHTAVVEVSSQAIACERIASLQFPICLFTNLAQDHIGEGEHPDYAHYRDQKARLFAEFGCRTMIANIDDEAAPFMMARASAPRMLTVSLLRRDATLFADRIRAGRRDAGFGSTFHLHEGEGPPLPVSLSLPGVCNVSNALMALCATREYLGAGAGGAAADLRALAPALEDFQVRGRFERVATVLPEVDFVIDYAHNGYSLAAAIETLRAYRPTRLVCLFGSVGARTYSRRTELATAAAAADFCIVTTDNPDTEAPEDTMRELCRVMEERGCEYVAIPDRAEAIRYAVRHAQPGDLVLLAGKGHEDYQLIAGRRIPFSERAILEEEAVVAHARPIGALT